MSGASRHPERRHRAKAQPSRQRDFTPVSAVGRCGSLLRSLANGGGLRTWVLKALIPHLFRGINQKKKSRVWVHTPHVRWRRAGRSAASGVATGAPGGTTSLEIGAPSCHPTATFPL